MEMPADDAGILARRDQIAARLRTVLADPAALITDPAETRAYECDALSAYRCPPMAVALPGSTEEVAGLLRICADEGVPVVPRGAGTSLAGGSMPTGDCLVIGLSRMTRVLEISPQDRLIRVETGRSNLSVSAAVAEDGFFYAPDPSSQLACAIGGNIAMNAGGAHCLKYGVTTHNLLGLRVVTMTGEILDLGGPMGESNGLDLMALLCGSEGQLGIVTEATLRILPKPAGARPVLIAFDSAVTAGACVAAIIRAGILPVAIEFMDRPCIRATEDFCGAGYPDCEALLIIEVEGTPPEIDEALTQIRDIAQGFAPLEFRESGSEAESTRIWLGRKSAFGAMGVISDYICLDGTVPVSSLPDVLAGISELSQKFGLSVANVFHAGDGNMHPLILYDANKPGDLERCEALGAEILRLCVAHDGCLSGEHGVGIEKRELMVAQFAPIDLEYQMRIKDVFDPQWRLNPAKVFPLAVSASRRDAARSASDESDHAA